MSECRSPVHSTTGSEGGTGPPLEQAAVLAGMPALSTPTPLAHLLIAVHFVVVEENVERISRGPGETGV